MREEPTFRDLDVIEEYLGSRGSPHLPRQSFLSQRMILGGSRRQTHAKLVEMFPDFKALRAPLDQKRGQAF